MRPELYERAPVCSVISLGVHFNIIIILGISGVCLKAQYYIKHECNMPGQMANFQYYYNIHT